MREVLFVRVRGFTDQGVKDYGRIIFEDGKFRTEGDSIQTEWILEQRIRNPRAGKDRLKRLTVEDGEEFLYALPNYFYGGRLHVGEVEELSE